jgi:hypothetical protein
VLEAAHRGALQTPRAKDKDERQPNQEKEGDQSARAGNHCKLRLIEV